MEKAQQVKTHDNSFHNYLLVRGLYDNHDWVTVYKWCFLGAKAPLGIARVKKGHEKVSDLNDNVRSAK